MLLSSTGGKHHISNDGAAWPAQGSTHDMQMLKACAVQEWGSHEIGWMDANSQIFKFVSHLLLLRFLF